MGLTAKKVYAVLNRKIKKISGDVSDTSELYEYHKPTDTWYKL